MRVAFSTDTSFLLMDEEFFLSTLKIRPVSTEE